MRGYWHTKTKMLARGYRGEDLGAKIEVGGWTSGKKKFYWIINWESV